MDITSHLTLLLCVTPTNEAGSISLSLLCQICHAARSIAVQVHKQLTGRRKKKSQTNETVFAISQFPAHSQTLTTRAGCPLWPGFDPALAGSPVKGRSRHELAEKHRGHPRKTGRDPTCTLRALRSPSHGAGAGAGGCRHRHINAWLRSHRRPLCQETKRDYAVNGESSVSGSAGLGATKGCVGGSHRIELDARNQALCGCSCMRRKQINSPLNEHLSSGSISGRVPRLSSLQHSELKASFPVCETHLPRFLCERGPHLQSACAAVHEVYSSGAQAVQLSWRTVSFRGAIQQGLPLEIGDTVQILEKCEGWFRGFVLKNPNAKVGGAPFCGPVLGFTMNGFNEQFETVIPTEDTVVTEMTSTLRDWGTMWKQLYVVNTLCTRNTQHSCAVLPVPAQDPNTPATNLEGRQCYHLNQATPSGFSYIDQPRSCGHGRRVAVLYRSTLKATTLQSHLANRRLRYCFPPAAPGTPDLPGC
ncbi:hypothetical protein AAFF_G00172780 [Aldrovandia affinis]|uniref:Dedicator of cytokinesis N-terminal domain-containing protein n=1 Tax=Aldrovandia affinis TaxID=143900 RepID=A0AAD7SYS5_9TELE|nr:hypothetical protein AAFF_G00172780 [Aldrovandia affinis]